MKPWRIWRAWPVWVLLLVSVRALAAGELPPGFVDVTTVVSQVSVELRYLGDDNFLGQPVDGYLAPRCILTREAATALQGVQADLLPYGLGVKVFDAYRPQRAVDHFVRWAKDLADTRMKSAYYPEVAKKDLFRLGYIAEKSGHSRGSTVDLTIVERTGPHAGRELDMGTGFDLFSPASWPASRKVTELQKAHRLLLRTLMLKHGFAPYEQEWWHFTLTDEPYPDTYFDFPVE